MMRVVSLDYRQLDVSSTDQMSAAQGTTPTAAQAGRLSPEETSALFVSIIIIISSLVPLLI